MWSTHHFQKHFCALLLSIAFITTIISLQEKLKKTNRKYFAHLSYVNHTGKQTNKSESNWNFPNINTSVTSNNHILYILGLFEITTKWGLRQESLSEISSAQLAVEHINKNFILPGYTIKLLINDTKCDPGVGIDRFFYAVYSERIIIMLLGSGCSNVTESLANVVPYWNILQVSFGSTSPILSDRNKFPLFFRTVAPDSSHNKARISFIKYFGWKIVATLSQSENAFLLPLNNLVGELENVNITCASTITFSLDNYKEQLRVLKELDTRIIIGSFSAEIAPKIMCEAFTLNMYGKDYVWMLKDEDTVWWKNNNECPNLENIVEGLILFADHNRITDNKTSISGLTNEKFEDKFNTSIKLSKYARQTYDAVWAMALGLNKTKSVLQDFHYKRRDMTQKFVQKISELSFMGVSGPIKFKGADRIGNTVFKQIQDRKIQNIAIYFPEEDFLDFHCKNCKPICWTDGQIPIARRNLKIRLVTIPMYVFYPVVLTSIAGILICFAFFYFNLHFRRVKTMKLSSPRLNNIAVLGCICVYGFVILLGIDHSALMPAKQFSKLCTVRVYLLSSGFSLAFGSMFAKTYRVHKIFICRGASVVKDRLLKDKQLIALILLPMIIDAIIVTLWVLTDPLQRHLHNLTVEISSKDRGVVYQPQVEICRSHNTSGWFIALYGYKGFLLIMGVYMAWETRLVKVPALNDSQYIGICVYSAISSAIIVILSNFLSEYVIISYLLTTVSILTSNTITLLLLLFPKLKAVLGDVECEDPIMLSVGLKFECNTRRLVMEDPKELIYRVEIQNKVYKNELELLDKEIVRLERLLEQPNTSFMEMEENGAYSISKAIEVLAVPRASWPSTRENTVKSRNAFLSESKLNKDSNEYFFEKLKIFDKLRRFFGSIPSVLATSPLHQDSKTNNFDKLDDVICAKPSSNPEFDTNKLLPVDIEQVPRTKSATNIAVHFAKN